MKGMVNLLVLLLLTYHLRAIVDNFIENDFVLKEVVSGPLLFCQSLGSQDLFSNPIDQRSNHIWNSP